MRAALKSVEAITDELVEAFEDLSAIGWPVPQPLDGELPSVRTFEEALLPESFRPLVCDVAERMQTPLDFPAAVAIVSLAGAVGRRARIQPKAADSSWIVVPNLWGGIVAPPGQLKSPIITAMTSPLHAIERGWRGDHEKALEDHRQAAEEHKLRYSAWQEKFKAAAKKGLAGPDRCEPAPLPPTMRRLILNDATAEKLHEIMAENPAGVLVIRDELTGWLAQLEKQGREGERAFALSAWNGDTGHAIDRIGRGSIYVPHCCMSLLGGIQPSRLRSYLSDALADGPSNDGLMQRFQVLVWPDTTAGHYVDRAPVAAYVDKVSGVFERLVAMDPDTSTVYKFSPKAQGLFVEWFNANEALANASDTHPALAAHLAKYRSLMPSLALLFELADGGEEHEVNLRHAQQAAEWCEYLKSHAERVYSCVSSPHMRAARELVAKIKARKIGADGSFYAREVYRSGWAGLDTPELVRAATEALQDAGWIRELKSEVAVTGGRPANRFEVNPAVRR
jgi:putative DNA primase/helicase